MINKLTGEPVSAEIQNVLKRLANSENVPEAEIQQLKEIREANSCLGNGVPTVKLKDREGIQNGVYNRLQKSGSAVTDENGHVSLTGEIRREKRLDIVIGLPASGKSSALVEPISEQYNSRIIDSDEAKKMLPEYNDGWGAGIVHTESQLIADRQFQTAIQNGENITYPRVGGDCAELTDIIAAVKKKGYSVYVHFNELDRNKALGRMINRFLETGRYIKPELVTKYGGSISSTYETLKNRTELVDGFSKWNNDVPLKEAPQSVKCFSVGENNVSTLKSTFEENGIECQFVGGKDGKISCIYPAECAEQVAMIKADYQKAYAEVSDQLSVMANAPETERQREISERIDALTNAEIGSEQRSQVYDSILADMKNRNVDIPQYSESNLQLIQNEMPYAKQAARKAFWEQQGYTLNENAKGVEILAPQIDENGSPVLNGDGKQVFTTVTVYDISETNAYETAVRDEISSLHSEYDKEKAAAFAKWDKKEIWL